MQPLLVTFAIPEEKIDFPETDFPLRTVFTGIGKTQAAMVTTEAILYYRPFAVLNVGTAGTLRHQVNDVIVSRHFVDRDLMPLAIEGLCAEVRIPSALFPELTPILQEITGLSPEKTGPIPDLVVSTGDNFVTQGEVGEADAVDMEAFAEAIVCRHFGLPFVSVKCITDVIGENSVATWAERLRSANEVLRAYFQQKWGVSSKSNCRTNE